MKTVSIHGATGSIGLNGIDIIKRHPEKFKAHVLIGGSKIEPLVQLAKETNAPYVAIADPSQYNALKDALPNTTVFAGDDGILEASSVKVDVCIAAITGSAGIRPTYTALNHCKVLGIANKESIVAAGEQILERAKQCGTEIVPVDSEHSAVFQVLHSDKTEALESITITASGGPFRSLPIEQFSSITKEMALKHPNWTMGPKNTIDSATLMNKGLEIIEAALLFNLVPNKVKAIIHPQSIIHGMSSYVDGTTLAHLSLPDMRTPISYALSYPDRISSGVQPLDLVQISSLTFEQPDYERFPCLKMAEDCLRLGQFYRIVMNAANEIAFNKFMNNEIHFTQIHDFIHQRLESIKPHNINTISDVISLDNMIRNSSC
ncbi:MAG: 1-deoxy-D-xylulose-5-phosphate reductoisomerase [Candidatus Paracaedibacteraceae bacterium]|nr:1-deoxy-D-xylulose-5-phosphate reductoisomerase [Candidatus Paracaedibacteraceae bacterium]